MQENKGMEETAISALSSELTKEGTLLLVDNGCKLVTVGANLVRIFYPQGTTRQELLPQTQLSRYRICLPSGLILRETEIPGKRTVVLKAHLNGDTREEVK